MTIMTTEISYLVFRETSSDGSWQLNVIIGQWYCTATRTATRTNLGHILIDIFDSILSYRLWARRRCQSWFVIYMRWRMTLIELFWVIPITLCCSTSSLRGWAASYAWRFRLSAKWIWCEQNSSSLYFWKPSAWLGSITGGRGPFLRNTIIIRLVCFAK